MLLRISLAAILLTLNCVCHATEHSRSALEKWRGEERAVTSGNVFRFTYDNVTSASSTSSINGRKGTATKVHSTGRDIYDARFKIENDKRDEGRRKKRKAGRRTMMALLMAYKLKFVALIPAILGGLILLKGTTLLAGFFFALFAAVLGLKMH